MISVGDVFETNECGSCVVDDYINSSNIKVRFEDGYEAMCQASQLRNGQVRNPYYPIIYGVGFCGKGIYSKTSYPRIYSIWNNMLTRCYSEISQIKNPTYIGCTVDESWHNFQNFAHDYLQMVGSDLDWQLDKDILFKGNKIYSKETCCLVPKNINTLLTKSDAVRGITLIGVEFDSRYKDSYIAKCSINGKWTSLGRFATELLAFEAYKEYKEIEIKRVANAYKNQLDLRVHKALIAYNVEITD